MRLSPLTELWGSSEKDGARPGSAHLGRSFAAVLRSKPASVHRGASSRPGGLPGAAAAAGTGGGWGGGGGRRGRGRRADNRGGEQRGPCESDQLLGGEGGGGGALPISRPAWVGTVPQSPSPASPPLRSVET